MDDSIHRNDESSHKSLDVVKYEKKPNPNRKFWVLLLVSLGLLGAMYFWKHLEVRKAKNEAKEEINAMSLRAHRTVIAAHEEHLKLLAKPLVWSVRTEMLNGNTGQVNMYSNELVKEKGFQQISIINDSGKVISATDKKIEGMMFPGGGNSAILSNNKTLVQNVGDTVFVISSPIMGFNSRLGTLVINYSLSPWKSAD